MKRRREPLVEVDLGKEIDPDPINNNTWVMIDRQAEEVELVGEAQVEEARKSQEDSNSKIPLLLSHLSRKVPQQQCKSISRALRNPSSQVLFSIQVLVERNNQIEAAN